MQLLVTDTWNKAVRTVIITSSCWYFCWGLHPLDYPRADPEWQRWPVCHGKGGSLPYHIQREDNFTYHRNVIELQRQLSPKLSIQLPTSTPVHR
jgi:hypothetical protein